MSLDAVNMVLTSLTYCLQALAAFTSIFIKTGYTKILRKAHTTKQYCCCQQLFNILFNICLGPSTTYTETYTEQKLLDTINNDQAAIKMPSNLIIVYEKTPYSTRKHYSIFIFYDLPTPHFKCISYTMPYDKIIFEDGYSL